MTQETFDPMDAAEAHVAAKARIPEENSRSVIHATFHLERRYDASPARLWKALTDPAAKAQWFGGPSEQVEIIERSMEVRPGGRELLKGRWGGRVVSTYDATYYDVIEGERLVYCYEMHLDDRKIGLGGDTPVAGRREANPAHAHRAGRISRRL